LKLFTRRVNGLLVGRDTPVFARPALQRMRRNGLIEYATPRRIKLGRRDQKAL